MKKKTIFIISGALIAVAVLVAVFFILQPKPQTVVSDDGSARLEIPKGALPEGVGANEIGIKKRIDVAPVGAYAVYDLEPDGLTFSKPAKITVTLPPTGGKIPVIVSESEGTAEILQTAHVSMGKDAVYVAAELNHFSVLTFWEGVFDVAITPAEVAEKVDDSFTMKMAVSVGDFYFVPLTIKSSTISGQWVSFNSGGVVVVGPIIGFAGDKILDPERSDKINETYERFHYSEATFTCVDEGNDLLVFVGELTSLGKARESGEDEPYSEASLKIGFESAVRVKCVKDENSNRAVVGEDTDESMMPGGENDENEEGGFEPEPDIPLEEYDKYPLQKGSNDAGGEGQDDCFVPKQGRAECIVDMLGATIERYSAGACQGVRATIETDTNLGMLAPQLQGEVVFQVHPRGGSNDGSADTGVGMGHYFGGKWTEFKFGPGGISPAPGVVSGNINGNRAVLQINSFVDGTCIADDSQARIKLEMANGPAGNRIYDIFGTDELMYYHSFSDLTP